MPVLRKEACADPTLGCEDARSLLAGLAQDLSEVEVTWLKQAQRIASPTSWPASTPGRSGGTGPAVAAACFTPENEQDGNFLKVLATVLIEGGTIRLDTKGGERAIWRGEGVPEARIKRDG